LPKAAISAVETEVFGDEEFDSVVDKALSEDVSELKIDLQKHKRIIRTLYAEVKEHRKVREELQTTIDAQNLKISEIVDKLVTDIQIREDETFIHDASYERQIHALQLENAALRSEITAMDTAFRSQITSMETEFRSKITAMETENAILRSENAELKANMQKIVEHLGISL